MEAPEKIYLQACGDCNDDDCKNCKFEDLEDNATWCMDKIFDKDIEYTRTEVFIDKAEKWLDEHIFDYVYAKEWGQGVGIEGELFDDFRNAMKGE